MKPRLTRVSPLPDVRAARVVEPHPAVRRLIRSGVPRSFFELRICNRPAPRVTEARANYLGRVHGAAGLSYLPDLDRSLGLDPALWRAWLAGYREAMRKAEGQ